MPEAPMHQDNLVETREHEIGCSGQVAPVQPEPVTETVGRAPDTQLRLRVRLADTTHVRAARFRRQMIWHRQSAGRSSVAVTR